LLGVLQKHVQVDFTVGNILEVVMWVIRNANQYIDSQPIKTYEIMVDKCNGNLQIGINNPALLLCTHNS
jgi:hypothetical protein